MAKIRYPLKHLYGNPLLPRRPAWTVPEAVALLTAVIPESVAAEAWSQKSRSRGRRPEECYRYFREQVEAWLVVAAADGSIHVVEGSLQRGRESLTLNAAECIAQAGNWGCEVAWLRQVRGEPADEPAADPAIKTRRGRPVVYDVKADDGVAAVWVKSHREGRCKSVGRFLAAWPDGLRRPEYLKTDADMRALLARVRGRKNRRQ